MNIDERAEVVVAGAGPAGLMAALTLAREGHQVMVADRKDRIGAPVRCAEGVGREALQRYISLDPGWISAVIRSVRLVAPGGTWVFSALLLTGWVLVRWAFGKALPLAPDREPSETADTYAPY